MESLNISDDARGKKGERRPGGGGGSEDGQGPAPTSRQTMECVSSSSLRGGQGGRNCASTPINDSELMNALCTHVEGTCLKVPYVMTPPETVKETPSSESSDFAMETDSSQDCASESEPEETVPPEGVPPPEMPTPPQSEDGHQQQQRSARKSKCLIKRKASAVWNDEHCPLVRLKRQITCFVSSIVSPAPSSSSGCCSSGTTPPPAAKDTSDSDSSQEQLLRKQKDPTQDTCS